MQQVISPESSKTPYFPALDGLRTIAVALVFAVHTLPRFVGFGWLGVQIFLVLSGFLITGILFDTRADRHRFRNFYARRVLRIFPLYYGVLIAISLALWITHGPFPRFFYLWWIYAGNFFWFVQHGVITDILRTGSGRPFAAVGHFWSLAVEEQFYLIWPWIVFAIAKRKSLIRLCLLLIVARVVLALYCQAHLSADALSNGFIYRMLPTQWDSFLIGGLLALWFRGGPSVLTRRRAARLGLPLAVAYFAALGFLHRHPGLLHGQDVYDYTSRAVAVWGLTLANLVFAAVLLAATEPGSLIYRFCNLPWMRSAGRVSYGIYVFHLPVCVFAPQYLDRLWAHLHLRHLAVPNAISCAALTLAAAYASYFGYERYFLLLKNRFTSREPGRAHLEPDAGQTALNESTQANAAN